MRWKDANPWSRIDCQPLVLDKVVRKRTVPREQCLITRHQCVLNADIWRFPVGCEAAAPSAEEQLAALQEALSTAGLPTAEAILPDGSELGSANLGRTYTHAALEEVFSSQRAKVCTLDLSDRQLCAQSPL